MTHQLIEGLQKFLTGSTDALSFNIDRDQITMIDWATNQELGKLLRQADTSRFEEVRQDGGITINKKPLAVNASPQYANSQADARLSTTSDPALDNPFQPRYRKLGDGELALHDKLKAQAFDLHQLMQTIPAARSGAGLQTDGEGQANIKLAFRHLEDSIFRAVKALTAS